MYAAFVLLCLLVWPGDVNAMLSDYLTHVEPTALRPVLDQVFVDPTFGSQITRITDPTMAPGALGLIQEYSRYPIPSADNTKVVVVVVGGEERGQWQVRGIRDHVVYNRIETDGDPEFSWHPTDPTRLFFRFGNTLRVYHTDTGTHETLMTFPGYVFVSSKEEGRPSDDWRYYAAIGVRPDGQRDILVADLTTKTVIGTLANVGTGIDWVGMSPSGQFVVVMFTDGKHTRVYDRQMVKQRRALSDFSHADFALDAQGDDVLVYIASTSKQVAEIGCPNPPNGSPLVSVRLRDGKKTIILGDCNTADWQMVITGTFLGWWFDAHFSGIISRARPGWVLVSTYPPDPRATQQPFMREVFLVALDGSGKVERLAHHHSLVAALPDGSRDYFAEPHASASWDGSLVLFASTWGATGQHYDLYMVGSAGIPPEPPVPPLPPNVSSGVFLCTWVWTTQSDGSVAGFTVNCKKVE
jgi:hypothetical protein